MRYLKLIFANYKYCLLRLLEFRAEVISWTFISVFWALFHLAIMNFIYDQVDSVAGWTRSEALVLSVTGSLFNSLLWFFVIPSLLDFGEKIRKGDFDFYLLRPVNPRFLISISRFEFDNYLRALVMILVIIKLAPMAAPINVSQIIGFIVLYAAGIAIYYSLFFLITTLSFWLVNMESLEDIFDSAVTLGRYPTNVFSGAFRIIFFYVVPMVFVATFPVQVLLGKSGWELVGLGVLMAGIFLFVSDKFWNFALRHYSSASS